MDAIRRDRIRQLAQQAHDQFWKDGRPLEEPATLSEVEAFEAQHGIRLPEAYREFILNVSNGCIGPDCHLIPFQDGAFMGRLAQPYPLTPFPPHLPLRSQNSDHLPIDQEASNNGLLWLAHPDCAYFIALVITGPFRGKVIYVVSNFPYATYFPDFLSWYETGMRESSAGYSMDTFGYGLPLEEHDLLNVLADHDESDEIREAALHTLKRAPELDFEASELLYRSLTTERCSSIAAQLIDLLAKQSIYDIKSEVWKWIPKVSGNSALTLANGLRKLGMPEWVEVYEEAIRKDEDGSVTGNALHLLSLHNAVTSKAIQLGFSSEARQAIISTIFQNSRLPESLTIPPSLYDHSDTVVRRLSVQQQVFPQLKKDFWNLLQRFDLETNTEVREGWAEALGKLAEDIYQKPLMERLKVEKHPKVITILAKQCALARAEGILPFLLELTHHENGELRRSAAYYLGVLGEKEAIPRLQELQNEDFNPTPEGGFFVIWNESIYSTIKQVATEALIKINNLDETGLPQPF